MQNEVIDMLINDDIDGLSRGFNIPDFVSKLLCIFYKNLNSIYHRKQIIDRLNNGYYSKEDEIKNMAKLYISKLILHSKDHGKSFLMEKCNLNEKMAESYINSYITANEYVKDLLSAELDVSNLNIQMDSLIDDLSDAFLSNKERIL